MLDLDDVLGKSDRQRWEHRLVCPRVEGEVVREGAGEGEEVREGREEGGSGGRWNRGDARRLGELGVGDVRAVGGR